MSEQNIVSTSASERIRPTENFSFSSLGERQKKGSPGRTAAVQVRRGDQERGRAFVKQAEFARVETWQGGSMADQQARADA